MRDPDAYEGLRAALIAADRTTPALGKCAQVRVPYRASIEVLEAARADFARCGCGGCVGDRYIDPFCTKLGGAGSACCAERI